MTYIKLTEHPGWIWDTEHDDCISPSGRTAPSPGKPFTGAISKKVHELILEEVNEPFTPSHPGRYWQDNEEDMITETEDKIIVDVELVKTITVGSVTINWYKASA